MVTCDGATALVTGGAGLIGSHIVDALLRRGCRVTILDNLERHTHPHGRPDWIPRHRHLRFLKGDVCKVADVKKALRGIDFIFHQAAFGGFTPQVSKYFDANVSGTARIYETIHRERLHIQKIVVASSQAVYGEGAARCRVHGLVHPGRRSAAALRHSAWEPRCGSCARGVRSVPTPEDTPPDPWLPYALSKWGAERVALCLGQRFGIPTTALRYAVTYGPRQSLFNPYTGVVSIFCTRIVNHRPPVLYEDGHQTRDFIYVDDVARANLWVAERPQTDFHVYNVGTGRATRLSDLATLLIRLLNVPQLTPHVSGDFREGDARHLVHDIRRLEHCGFHATISLEQGLSQFVQWLHRQGNVREYFATAARILCRWGVVQSSVVSQTARAQRHRRRP